MALPANGETVKLGRGSLLLDQLTSAGVSTGFDFKDNATAISIAASVSKAQVFSSTQRSSPLLAETPYRLEYTITATLTGFTLENLKQWLLGTKAKKVQAAATGINLVVPGDQVFAGRYYQTNDRNISNVTGIGDATEALVENEDFVVVPEFGLIGVKLGGKVKDGDDVTFVYDRPARTIDQVRIGTDAAPVCHLLFLADDANQDGMAARDKLEIWRVNLTPNGDFNLISDDYGNYQMQMSVLGDSANHPQDPFGVLERVAA